MSDSKKWLLKEDSYYVLRVQFYDGNKRSFYSMDWKSPSSLHKDKELGKKRLLKLANGLAQNAKKMIIYDLETDTPIYRYKNGIEIKD